MDRQTIIRRNKQIKTITKYIAELADNKDIVATPDPHYKPEDDEGHPIPNKWYLKYKVDDGIYAGHTFLMEVVIRYNDCDVRNNKKYYVYPFNRPRCKFIGYIPFHTNIYQSGAICVDFTNYGIDSNHPGAWKPRSFLGLAQSYMALFCDQNPSSPANGGAGSLFRECEKKYKQVSRDLSGDELTECYNDCFKPLIDRVNEQYEKSKPSLIKLIQTYFPEEHV